VEAEMSKKTKKSKATKTMREQGRYVLVVHMTVAQQKKMDSRKGKLSRSEWARKRLGL
jgi:hypothetical protein